MTYATALANYRNVVNEKFPCDPTSTKSKRRLQNLKSNKSGDKRKRNDDGNSNQSRNNNRSGSNRGGNNPNDGNRMRSKRDGGRKSALMGSKLQFTPPMNYNQMNGIIFLILLKVS